MNTSPQITANEVITLTVKGKLYNIVTLLTALLGYSCDCFIKVFDNSAMCSQLLVMFCLSTFYT